MRAILETIVVWNEKRDVLERRHKHAISKKKKRKRNSGKKNFSSSFYYELLSYGICRRDSVLLFFFIYFYPFLPLKLNLDFYLWENPLIRKIFHNRSYWFQCDLWIKLLPYFHSFSFFLLNKKQKHFSDSLSIIDNNSVVIETFPTSSLSFSMLFIQLTIIPTLFNKFHYILLLLAEDDIVNVRKSMCGKMELFPFKLLLSLSLF